VTVPGVTGTSERGTLVQRLRAVLVAFGSWLACRLPEGLLIRLANVAGELWYRLTPARRGRARANLARVVANLAATGRGPERARAAASDERALERLVRSAYRHAARYYLEVARTPAMNARTIRERLLIETPDVVEDAFRDERPVIFVGLHFGAIELPALYLAWRTGRIATAPMETIGDPALQRYFVRTRGSVGVRIVGLREARRELLSALRRGEPVGLVGDRDLTGGGVEIELFGAPARLPVGPALLAIEAEVPLYVAAVRREGIGRYRGQLRRVDPAPGSSRRERLTVTLEVLARAFEDSIAEAPDQWWAVFFPIWPDLAARTSEADAEPGAAIEPLAHGTVAPRPSTPAEDAR
jgi:KDO2-lipid IV(A) lauroyltransferase